MTWTKSAQMGWGLATCKAGTIGEGLRFLVTQFSGIRSHTWQLYLVYPDPAERLIGQVAGISRLRSITKRNSVSRCLFTRLGAGAPNAPTPIHPPLQTHSKTLRILAEVS